MNGGQYEERKKQKQAKENKKQAPMDCDCCYRNSRGKFCSMRGRVLSYAVETCSGRVEKPFIIKADFGNRLRRSNFQFMRKFNNGSADRKKC